MKMDPSRDMPKKYIFSGVNNNSKTPKNSSFAKFLLLSSNQSTFNTPSPALKNRIVNNPFDSNLNLHLPMISSPSLFTSVTTPTKQGCSDEQFEWTIDELSNLNPKNFVPHESQFSLERMDPSSEAECQAAINSYFTEQQIVPSPRECVLRNHKIILNESIINSTALSDYCAADKLPLVAVKIEQRDNSTQTAITLPPILPEELENMLKKFNLISDCESTEPGDVSMMDISTLRRKLFISHHSENDADEDSLAVHLSPAPKTPELTLKIDDRHIISSAALQNMPNDSFGSDMFGELSPIGSCSPVFRNDINKTSNADDNVSTTPPSSMRGSRKMKKGKNLSESFCLCTE